AIVPPILISRGCADTGVSPRPTMAVTASITPSTRALVFIVRPPPSSDPEIGPPDRVGAPQLRARALHHDAAGLEHVGAMADPQRLHHVLLDEQDAHAVRV